MTENTKLANELKKIAPKVILNRPIPTIMVVMQNIVTPKMPAAIRLTLLRLRFLNTLEFQFLANAFNRFYVPSIQPFSDFSDVDIYGSFADKYIISPNFMKDFIAFEDLARLFRQQI